MAHSRVTISCVRADCIADKAAEFIDQVTEVCVSHFLLSESYETHSLSSGLMVINVLFLDIRGGRCS